MPGQTQRVVLASEDDPLLLRAGGRLDHVEIAYETYGELSPERVRDVYLLRADAIAANDGQAPSATREYRVLRQIALEHPQLTTTVWRLLGSDRLRAA